MLPRRLHVPPAQVPRRFGVGVAAISDEGVREVCVAIVARVERVPEQVAAEGVDAGRSDARLELLGLFNQSQRGLGAQVRAGVEEDAAMVEDRSGQLVVLHQEPERVRLPVQQETYV